MLRFVAFLTLLSAFLGLTAYQSERFIPEMRAGARFNSAGSDADASFAADAALRAEADSSANLRVLMLNYSAFEGDYAGKVLRVIQNALPGTAFTSFAGGSADELASLLKEQHAVVAPYVDSANYAQLRAYGAQLEQFVQHGGLVIFTGTHRYDALQEYGLFGLDFGYYSQSAEINTNGTHPILRGVPAKFISNSNFVYPLDISDPSFTPVATIQGYAAVGIKSLGLGKVAYLGFEYYTEEAYSARILRNTLQWGAQSVYASVSDSSAARAVKRTEEIFTAGSGKNRLPKIELKIFPNPYMAKAALDFEIKKTTTLSLEMTDENGRVVAKLLQERALAPGDYHFELPNVEAGVYFVKCQAGASVSVRKVVKMAMQ